MNILILIFIGFLVGLFVISMGGGGAAVYLGVLTTIVGLEGTEAVSTSLVIAFPALVFGAFSYYRQKKINFKLGCRMLLSALPAVVIGSLIAPFIHKNIFNILIGVILAFLGVQIFIQVLKRKTMDKEKKKEIHPFVPVIYAIISGLMVGIGGLSGGGPIVAGLLIMGLDMVAASATSSFILVGMTFVGIIFHLSGNIDWVNGIGLMIGSLVGAFSAPIFLSHINTNKLTKIVKPIMGILLFIMGIANILDFKNIIQFK